MVNLNKLSQNLIKRHPEEYKINEITRKIIFLLFLFGFLGLFLTALGVVI